MSTNPIDQPEKSAFLDRFGQNLKARREAAALSQEKLGVLCFLRHDEISALERGRRTPNLIVLSLLADALGTSVASLTEGLRAPLRQAATSRVLSHFQDSHSTASFRASVPGLPASYVGEVTRRLVATGQIVRGESSWEVVSPGMVDGHTSERQLTSTTILESPKLTRREQQVAAIIRKGGGHSDIAGQLHITRETARSHTAQLRKKYAVTTTNALMAALIQRRPEKDHPIGG